MGLFGKKKKELLEWQKIVMVDSPDKLIMNQKQLQQTSNQQAADDLRVIQDCIKIISETTNPDTFFMRLDLLKEKAAHLIPLEPYVKFTGSSLTDAVKEIIEQEQTAIYEFIIRYYSAVFSKTETLKTTRGKKNQFQKFFDSLEKYQESMDKRNLNYIAYKRRHFEENYSE